MAGYYVVRFRGGLFENSHTAHLAHQVMQFALLTFVVYTIATIVELASPQNRDILSNADNSVKNDLDNVSNSTVAGVIFNTIIALCFFGAIMGLGYYGAKNSNRSALALFACCSALCLVCSFLSVLSFFVAVGLGTATCQEVDSAGYNPAMCYISVVLTITLLVLYLVNTYLSTTLYTESALVVAHTYTSQPAFAYAESQPQQQQVTLA